MLRFAKESNMAIGTHLLLFVAPFFLCSFGQGNAVSVDTVGRHFVFAYPTPYYPTSRYTSYTPKLFVVVTNPSTTQATVTLDLWSPTDSTIVRTLPSKNIDNTRPGNFSIDFSTYFGRGYYQGTDPPKTIHISSTGDVSVVAHYSYNQRYSTWLATGTIILPVASLGTDHYIVSYRPDTNYMSEFTITAAEETKVTIRGTDGFRDVRTIPQYGNFEYRSPHDLTGSRIKSDKPVSIIAGVSQAKVPDGTGYRAYLVAQMPGIDGVGMNYILSPFGDRTRGYVFRIVGTLDNTMITIPVLEQPSIELHAGEMVEVDMISDNITMISANKPIYVCQFMKGYVSGDNGNAVMVLVPGMEMFPSASVTFSVSALPSKEPISYYASITIKCDLQEGLQMDGSDLLHVWDTLPGPRDMCILRKVVAKERVYKVHHTSSDVPFSVMVYASAYKVSYAYMAGYNVRNRTPILMMNSTSDVLPKSDEGISLICEDNMMTIFVNKSYVIDGLPSDVHLIDAYCFGRMIDVGTSQKWIRITSLYSECGTTIEEGESGSVYKNTLIYAGPKDDTVVIGRDATFTIPITCSFQDRALASLRIRPRMSVMNGTLSGFGNLANVTFALKMFRSLQYATPYRSEDFPVTVTVGKPIYLEAKASGGDDIQLLVDTCLATHSDNPRQKPNYIFIDDGCPTDETVQYYSNENSPTQRFSTLAFTLADGDNPTAIAYIHCWMIACNSSDSGSRCQRDCTAREKRGSSSIRRSPSSDHFVVSWGPLIILSETNGHPEEDSKFQFTTLIVGVSFFVIGVAAAAFGMITIVRSKRNKRRSGRSWFDSHEDRYQLLKMEDFDDESYE